MTSNLTDTAKAFAHTLEPLDPTQEQAKHLIQALCDEIETLTTPLEYAIGFNNNGTITCQDEAHIFNTLKQAQTDLEDNQTHGTGFENAILIQRHQPTPWQPHHPQQTH